MSSAADRQRAYRQRQRGNKSVLRIEIDEFGLIDALIEVGRITEAESTSRAGVERVVSSMIDDWQKTVTRNASNQIPRATFPFIKT